MIGGKSRKELCITAILEMITPYDIYKFYFGDFKVNEITTNHIRGDRSPSFIIGNKGGDLHHFDFADSAWRGDCFEFVQTAFGLNLNDALKKIDADFGLGISSAPLGDYKKITSEYKQPEELGKRYSLIQVITKPFTKDELAYWNQYHQDIADLRANNVYSVKTVYLNRSKFPMNDTDLRFGYLYDGHWKIYRPYGDKKRKWVPNNVPITMMDGRDNIRGCDTCLINKSKKDFMVMKKVYGCSCAVQNESIGCFSPENIEYLKANSRRQILSFDSDPAGVQNSQLITKILGFDYCNVPRKYLSEGIKDWADLGRIHGLSAIEDYLKEKGLL